ncbi:MAG: menaquinol oxidoreductase [Desulfosporosinus sp. BRH_c37]|nr:MAG: menaquinol oxidoreductase [Desulfosporosinus sp. BRH_c37]
MYKGGKIIVSLIIFIGIFTIPFFYNMGKANAGPDINLNSPVIQQLADKQCVEPTEFMRANHMQILSQWREEVVRNGQSVYVNSQGKSFEISLQNTCLKCHTTEAEKAAKTGGTSNSAVNASPQFCASCHVYTAVNPNCWDCHFEPKGAMK